MSAETTPIGRLAIVLLCAGTSFLVFFLFRPTFLLVGGVLLAFGFLVVSARWPDMGTLAVLFLLYTNLAVLAVRPPGEMGAAAGPRTAVALVGMWLVLGATLAYQLFVRKEKLLFDRGFMLMLLFLGACLASSLFARGEQPLGKFLGGFLLEGLVLFFLLTNVIRDSATLRRATWALLLAGALMASFSLVQKVTHTEQKTYGGFALMDRGPEHTPEDEEALQRQRAAGKIESGGELVGQARAGGPVDASNLYAEILMVLLPFGALQFRTEKSRKLRILALVAAGLIFGGLLLTFSRGCILAAIVVSILMGGMGLLKLRQLLTAALVGGLLIAVLQPTVVTRMLSLERISALLPGSDASDKAPDSSMVLRYELDLAAWRVFLSHPILGVGPGQFVPYYSMDYVNRVGLRPLTKGYQAHNLYFQALAETGLIGAICFVSIPASILFGLWAEWKRSLYGHSEVALTASAFFLSLVALSIASLFSPMTDQRYFWLLLALCSAAGRVLHRCSEQHAADEAPGGVSRVQSLWLETGDAHSN